MSYTATSCAAREFEERVDRYDDILGTNPAVLKARTRITDKLEHLRQSLVQFHVPPETLQTLKDIEDMVTELEAQDVLAIAGADMDDVCLAISLGLKCRPEELHNRKTYQDGKAR